MSNQNRRPHINFLSLGFSRSSIEASSTPIPADVVDEASIESQSSILDSEAGEERCGGKISRCLHFGSLFVVLSDSEVRFGKINLKRIGSVDFQPILINLRRFQKCNFSTPASYLAPSTIDLLFFPICRVSMWS